jgi:hypothetical protein
LTRRVQRPETSDLAAMRELANTHARIAIDTHGSKRLLKVAAARFGTAAVCVAASAVLLHLTSYEYRASRTLIMAGFVASIYLLWQGSKAVQAMVKLLHAKKGTAAPPTEETEPSA